ncbi:MAG: hypothetical protein KF836_11770 [Fimbriimonadaceae bacterium]|nr:hypothetical protein [Fimbriimonadaceae bacterium]
MLDQLPLSSFWFSFLTFFLPWLVLTVGFVFVVHYVNKSLSRKQGKVSKEVHRSVEQAIHQIIPSTIWLPIYVKVKDSSEIVVRWNSHFLLVSTAAVSDLNNEELAFLVKSERRHLKLFQKKYMPALMAFIFVPLYSMIFVSTSTRISFLPFILPVWMWITAAAVIPLTHWARQHSDKWRKLADEQTVAEIPHPQVASTAVEKSIRSAVADSAQTPYQLSMKRLEAVENAIRLRETT